MDLLLVSEVAERLRCSHSMVYDHIAQGRLQAYKVGGKKGYRVSEEQLQAFLRGAETQAAADEEPALKHVR
jgi:excisionase family DNA binding protein